MDCGEFELPPEDVSGVESLPLDCREVIICSGVVDSVWSEVGAGVDVGWG